MKCYNPDMMKEESKDTFRDAIDLVKRSDISYVSAFDKGSDLGTVVEELLPVGCTMPIRRLALQHKEVVVFSFRGDAMRQIGMVRISDMNYFVG